MNTTAAANVRTHTNTVHAGRVHAATGILVPVCMNNTQVAGLHYTTPTDTDVTCKRCAAGVTTAPKVAAAAAPAKVVAPVVNTAALAFVAGRITAVRITDSYGTAWLLHHDGDAAPIFVALTLKDAKATAARHTA